MFHGLSMPIYLNINCLWKFLSKIVLFIAYFGFLLSRTVSIPILSSRTKFATLTPWLELALSEVRILRARLAEKQVQITDLESRNKTLTVSNEQSVSQVENLVEEKKSLMDTMKYLQEELIKSGKSSWTAFTFKNNLLWYVICFNYVVCFITDCFEIIFKNICHPSLLTYSWSHRLLSSLGKPSLNPPPTPWSMENNIFFFQ